jgi:hypothetical protein
MTDVLEEKPVRIPPISDERIAELSAQIRPVVRMARVRVRVKHYSNGATRIKLYRSAYRGKWQPWPAGELYYIMPVNARGIAFPWSPKRDVLAEGLIEIARITTLHTYAYHGFFKPTIAEVLSQIPEEYLGQVIAFETHGPETADDLNSEWELLNEGYHVAETILYGKL